MKIAEILANIKKNGAEVAVFEDNGGGLTLAIWYSDDFFCHTGYEYNAGGLVDDLVNLASGGNPNQWENMDDMTMSEWEELISAEYGGHIILDMDGLNSAIMGSAGRVEFEQFLPKD
nr:hypothetical protein [uncultured Ottowia sp.]